MIKRMLSGFLCLLVLIPLVACSEEAGKAETAEIVETKIESDVKTEDEKTEEAVTITKELGEVEYDRVDTPLTPERLAAIPIAKEGMSSDQLRQICVDYVKLSVSFQWVPSKSFDYLAASDKRYHAYFYEGKLHGGIPYINVASGNLYRILEFYDTETGVLDVEYLVQNPIMFGTACSGTTGWGWARVINSATCSYTANLNAAGGLVPVGPYTYDLTTVRYGEDGKEECKTIARRNGEQVMYESYALSLKADCFVNNGHVRMNGENPVVVRKEDGTIDGEKSYIVQVEQGLYTNGANHKRLSADGVEYVIQGNDGVTGDGTAFYFTFKELFDSGYLPHTFKEFHSQDPIEPGEATTNIATDKVNLEALKDATLTANYAISDIFFVITDTEGKEIVRYAYRLDKHYQKQKRLKEGVPSALLWMNRDKGYTLSLEVQLGNGERVTAYKGELVT
ncbi:MAG: hypothetical protein IKJ74_05490 [Clostridia bacterium]|nr:hypothetical protein [Clostridia bacterium]